MQSISRPMLDFLRAAVEGRINILISGGAGSGKTTLLNVLSAYVPAHERLVTIEDSAELRLQRKHVVSLETRIANAEGRGDIAPRDLEKVLYFASSIITSVNEEEREADLPMLRDELEADLTALEADIAEEKRQIEAERDRRIAVAKESLSLKKVMSLMTLTLLTRSARLTQRPNGTCAISTRSSRSGAIFCVRRLTALKSSP